MMKNITIQSALLNEIDSFRKRHNMSIRQFGMLAVKCHKVIPKLERGGVLVKTADKLRLFMEQYDKSNTPAPSD